MKIYVSPIILDSPQDAFTARWLASLDGMILPPPPDFRRVESFWSTITTKFLGGSHEYSNLCSVFCRPDQSIEGQLRVCTNFCKQRGLTVIDTYCDRHISGRTDERPEFQRLIADAKRKKFEAVVVYKTDRFARNKYDSAVYKRELKRNGIQIFYAAEAIPDGPEGIILESLMEGLAEYYSAELAQKIKRGMHESALKCQSTGSGRPLGYRVDGQKHFQTVQTIFEQYIKGESNAAICELLNSRGQAL